MRYFQLIDMETNECQYARSIEVPFTDLKTRIFESFDGGRTYLEIQK